MEQKAKKQKPIINAHAHVFTSKHVPPLLTKKFVPFPFYYLAHLSLVIGIYKLFRKFNGLYFQNWHRNLRRVYYYITVSIRRNPILAVIFWVLGAWLTLLTFYFLYDLILDLTHSSGEGTWLGRALESLRKLAIAYQVLPTKATLFLKILIALFVFVFVKSGRNLILFLFKKIFKFFKILPGAETRKLMERYLLLAKYAVYKQQTHIFSKMKDQYPQGSGFILLPMDMEYMEAGPCQESYLKQLEDLEKIKSSAAYKKQGVKIYPFLFVDPRRIKDQKSKAEKDELPFFAHTWEGNQVVLKESVVKTYMEDHKFSGFKIYPALGYYPFEKELLPLWKYAADHQIPILSHCIKGTIFYRGSKKTEWDEHWVFRDENTQKKLLLPETKNVDFQNNFTHPMNYLCLLEEPLLRILVEKYNDPNINEIFGYNGPNEPMARNLNQLKICMAHYGGEDQWKKYLDKDSYGYSQQVNKNTGIGIEFLKTKEGSKAIDFDRLALMWKYVDWYSIISSMMMQYPNVYADISYILHDKDIFPLLKETLKTRHGKLRDRVLFGTDFYVVRNHNSEKELFVSSDAELDDEEFDLIARSNPDTFLKRTKTTTS